MNLNKEDKKERKRLMDRLYHKNNRTSKLAQTNAWHIANGSMKPYRNVSYYRCSCGHVSVFHTQNTYCRPCLEYKKQSDLSDKQYVVELRTKENICFRCGVHFFKKVKIGIPNNIKYCSVRCSKAIQQRGRNTSNGQRARRKGLLTQEIKSEKVFNVYKWKCVSCGIKTPKELMGLNKDNAPTLDHIIPISKGGANVYGNLQLLCRKCNCQVKGDSMTNMQLPLFFQKVNQRTKAVVIKPYFDPGSL